MQRIPVHDAQTELQRLVEAAVRGETVLIVGDHEQTVQLVPIALDKQARHAGSAKGQITFAADFDAPL
jgi:antitoxin (DNA-binding transcriptional repressor) of toxin-antitoxin stability system